MLNKSIAMNKLIFLFFSFLLVTVANAQEHDTNMQDAIHDVFLTDSVQSAPANEIDTGYIEKKNRIVGIYHSPNQRINGLSIGWGKFGDGLNYNVNTNGLRLEVLGTSFFSFIIVPYLVFPPGYLNEDGVTAYISDLKMECEMKRIRYTNRYEKTNGISASLFGSFEGENHTINGMQFSGILYPYYQINGFSTSLIMDTGYKGNGLSIGGISNTKSNNNGVMIGGLWSFSSESNGIQIGGLWNKSFDLKGIQIGGYNQSDRVYGLQIGIFNSTKILKGFQIGLWNKNKKRSLPLINWGF